MSRTGDLTPEQAWALLTEDGGAAGGAVLVDVRTQAEWAFVGVPDLSALAASVTGVEWTTFPGGQPNPDFTAELQDALRRAGAMPATPLVFLCRSGHRSLAAADAAAAAGWQRTYNVLDGFEGPVEDDGHRGRAGWKASGLPWRQS